MTQTNPNLSFGLWYAFRNPLPWRRSYQDIYTEILEQIVWAEGIGYDDVWTLPPGYPVKKMNEHLELFATKVMSHFR
jgi:hypothetical protein